MRVECILAMIAINGSVNKFNSEKRQLFGNKLSDGPPGRRSDAWISLALTSSWHETSPLSSKRIMVNTKAGADLRKPRLLRELLTEVKSKLTHDKLTQALENCASVIAVSGHLKSFTPLNQRANFLVRQHGLTHEQAEDAVRYSVVPHTYIFSFTSDMSAESLCGVVNKHYNHGPTRRSAFFTGLPTVIVTHGAVGLLRDEWLVITGSDQTEEEVKAELGQDARVVMGFWDTPRQFGWFALRLMHDVTERLAGAVGPHQFPFTIDAYLPVAAYHREYLYDQTAQFIYWSRESPTPPSINPPDEPAPAG